MGSIHKHTYHKDGQNKSILLFVNLKKAIFAPKELKDPKFIDGFRGIYMPYWTYYVTQKAPI